MGNYKVEITGINTDKLKTLKSRDTIELIKRMNKGEDVKDEIVMGNLKLVLSSLKPYRMKKICLDDLFQVGVVGLIKAIDNFDCSKEVMFSTYAVPMIRGEIKRYVRDSSSLLKVSRQVKDLAYHCFAYQEQYQNNHERSPSYMEIADELGVDVYDVDEAMCSTIPVLSFNEPINNDGQDELELYDIVKDDEEQIEKVVQRLTLREAIRKLDELEQIIIDRRYFKDQTQSEIAKELNISQAQVSRIEKQALKDMKKYF